MRPLRSRRPGGPAPLGPALAPIRVRVRPGRAFPVLASLLLAACAPPPAGSAETKPAAAPAAKQEAAPLTLAGLPAAMARLEELKAEVAHDAATSPAERAAAAEMEATRGELARARQGIEALPADEMRELQRRALAAHQPVEAMEGAVTARLAAIEERLLQVTDLKGTMDALADLAGRMAAPPSIRLRTGICRSDLEELDSRLVARRNEVLLQLGTLAEVRASSAALESVVKARLTAARSTAEGQGTVPVWSVRFAGWEAFAGAAQRVRRDTARVGDYLRQNAGSLVLAALLAFGATGMLLRRLRPGAARRAASDPAALATLRSLERPFVAAIPVAAFAVVFTAPLAPAFFYDLALVPAAVAAAWLVGNVLGPGVGRTVWVLAAALCLVPLRGPLELFPLVSRLVFLLQTLPLAAVLALDLSQGRLGAGLQDRRLAAFVRRGGWLLAACLSASATATVLGRLRLARLLGVGALGTLGGAVLVAAATLVVSGLVRSLLASDAARRSLLVRKDVERLTAVSLKVLRLAAAALGLLFALLFFRLVQPIVDVVGRISRTKAALGSVTISVGSILTFLAILAVAVALSRLATFVLVEEVLPRLSLGRGVAFAVSASTRYLLLVGGFFLAAAAAGIDLSQLGLVIGALGVGIGLGLQNIVGNFISGLILLFEGPIQVGDTVELSGTTGSVTQIGIRASRVRTFDGAEVIVPNADLISKPVVNWTLSDPNRRFDVGVGVAYGSPLEATAQALLAAARRTAGVLPGPAPEAFLDRFGESSLDWVLRVWARMEAAPRVLGALKRAVNEELARAGIEVPFPQLELNLRAVAPAAGAALRGESPSGASVPGDPSAPAAPEGSRGAV